MHVLPNLVVKEKSYIYKTYLPHKTDTVGLCGLRRLSPVFWFGKKGETMFWTALVCHTCLQNILIGCAFITCKHARLNMAINKKTQSNSLVFSSLMVIHKKIWAGGMSQVSRVEEALHPHHYGYQCGLCFPVTVSFHSMSLHAVKIVFSRHCEP